MRKGCIPKRKGRRSWDGGPSGLLLLQTPGLAECEVGRLLKFRYDSGAYQLNLRLRTDIRGFLRSSFFAGSAFLLFFTGLAVGFMILFFIPAQTWQAKCNSRAKTCSHSLDSN